MSLTTARFWREIPQRYRMEAGKCTGCGEIQFPPRRICPECGKREFETVTLANQGEIETYTVIHVAPDEFTDLAPYAIGLVKLDDGVKIMCQIADIDLDGIEIGQRVQVEFRRIRDDGQAGMLFYGYKCVPARD